MKPAPIDRHIARAAARWFLRLQGGASDQDRADCARWRASHADHERAWQLAELFHARLRDIPAAVARPTLAQPRGVDRRGAVKLLALLVAAGPAAVIGQRELCWFADQRTAVGEQRGLTLPDGTDVRLNTASALDVAFDREQRLLRLRAGEMLVNTAADAARRPLLVATREGIARPVGTRFTVRQLDGRTEVAVFEGAVQLQPARAAVPVLVPAGRQARFSAARVERPTALRSQASDWARGVLRADDMRLGDFAAELGRYRPGLLRCDPSAAGLRISGTFQLHDIDKALAAVARTLPVDIHYRTRYWVTIAAR